MAYVTVETTSVRYRDDGTDPTASVGILIASAAQLQYFGTLSAIKFIATSGTATLDVGFYK